MAKKLSLSVGFAQTGGISKKGPISLRVNKSNLSLKDAFLGVAKKFKDLERGIISQVRDSTHAHISDLITARIKSRFESASILEPMWSGGRGWPPLAEVTLDVRRYEGIAWEWPKIRTGSLFRSIYKEKGAGNIITRVGTLQSYAYFQEWGGKTIKAEKKKAMKKDGTIYTAYFPMGTDVPARLAIFIGPTLEFQIKRYFIEHIHSLVSDQPFKITSANQIPGFTASSSEKY